MVEIVYVTVAKNGGSLDLSVKPHAFEQDLGRYKNVFAGKEDTVVTQLGNFKRTPNNNQNETTYVGQIEM